MRNEDLAQLRAQLRATAQPQREQPKRSLLGRLRALTNGAPDQGVLTLAEGAPARPPVRKLPTAYDLEPAPDPVLVAEETRRQAFGQRVDAYPAAPALAAAVERQAPLLLLPTAAMEVDELGAALRLLRPALVRRPEAEPEVETPFLDQDLDDDFDAENIYRAAGMLPAEDAAPAPEPAPDPAPEFEAGPSPLDACALLARLGERIEAELAGLDARRASCSSAVAG